MIQSWSQKQYENNIKTLRTEVKLNKWKLDTSFRLSEKLDSIF